MSVLFLMKSAPSPELAPLNWKKQRQPAFAGA